MKIRYRFTTGEHLDIEVTEEWGQILSDLDKQERNNNQREQRRHTSLNALAYEGEFFIDLAADVVGIAETNETCERLQLAIGTLLPQQQELLKKVCFERQSIVSVAREEGVSEAAIRDRLKRIEKKLKHFFDTDPSNSSLP